MTALQKRFAGAVLAVVVGAGIYESIKLVRLRQANRTLLEQGSDGIGSDAPLRRTPGNAGATPKLPAPHIPVAAHSLETAGADESVSAHVLALASGEKPKLTSEQIESYLEQNHRSAASLLAIAKVTGDKAFLKEAMERFPDDPRVAFDAVFLEQDSPDQRREWVERLKQNAPDNALASYVSALDYFKSGQNDQAVQELISASAKTQFQDYFWDQVQNTEEAWRTAGLSELDTRVLAMTQALLPHLGQLKQLNNSIVDLASAYQKSGDDASAQALMMYDLQLGERVSQFSNDPLITQLVAMAIQRNALKALDPGSPYGSDGLTVAGRLEQIRQQQELIKNLNQQVQSLLPLVSAQDFITGLDRRRAFGELNAMQWLVSKYGQNGSTRQ